MKTGRVKTSEGKQTNMTRDWHATIAANIIVYLVKPKQLTFVAIETLIKQLTHYFEHKLQKLLEESLLKNDREILLKMKRERDTQRSACRKKRLDIRASVEKEIHHRIRKELGYVVTIDLSTMPDEQRKKVYMDIQKEYGEKYIVFDGDYVVLKNKKKMPNIFYHKVISDIRKYFYQGKPFSEQWYSVLWEHYHDEEGIDTESLHRIIQHELRELEEIKSIADKKYAKEMALRVALETEKLRCEAASLLLENTLINEIDRTLPQSRYQLVDINTYIDEDEIDFQQAQLTVLKRQKEWFQFERNQGHEVSFDAFQALLLNIEEAEKMLEIKQGKIKVIFTEEEKKKLDIEQRRKDIKLEFQSIKKREGDKAKFIKENPCHLSLASKLFFVKFIYRLSLVTEGINSAELTALVMSCLTLAVKTDRDFYLDQPLNLALWVDKRIGSEKPPVRLPEWKQLRTCEHQCYKSLSVQPMVGLGLQMDFIYAVRVYGHTCIPAIVTECSESLKTVPFYQTNPNERIPMETLVKALQYQVTRRRLAKQDADYAGVYNAQQLNLQTLKTLKSSLETAIADLDLNRETCSLIERLAGGILTSEQAIECMGTLRKKVADIIAKINDFEKQYREIFDYLCEVKQKKVFALPENQEHPAKCFMCAHMQFLLKDYSSDVHSVMENKSELVHFQTLLNGFALTMSKENYNTSKDLPWVIAMKALTVSLQMHSTHLREGYTLLNQFIGRYNTFSQEADKQYAAANKLPHTKRKERLESLRKALALYQKLALFYTTESQKMAVLLKNIQQWQKELAQYRGMLFQLMQGKARVESMEKLYYKFKFEQVGLFLGRFSALSEKANRNQNIVQDVMNDTVRQDMKQLEKSIARLERKTKKQDTPEPKQTTPALKK